MEMNEEPAAQRDENRFEILTLAHQRQCEAIDYHNDLAFKIFSWSTTWLLAITGYILSQSTIDFPDCMFLAVAMVMSSAVSLWWQYKNKQHISDHAENLARLNEIFHLREPGYFHEEPIYGTELHTRASAWQVHFAYHLVLVIVTTINLGLLFLKSVIT